MNNMEEIQPYSSSEEIEALKSQVKLLSDKLCEVVNRLGNLEYGAETSFNSLSDKHLAESIKTDGSTFVTKHFDSVQQTDPKKGNEEHHVVSTAYCSRFTKLSKECEKSLLNDITIRPEDGYLLVESVSDSALPHKVLNVGDSIIAVNGVPVSTEEEFHDQVKSSEQVSLEIVPSALKCMPFSDKETYLKCLFDYNPSSDSRLDQKAVGLQFKIGDILQVSCKEDQDWWQARKVDEWSSSGLIPSISLQKSTHDCKSGVCENGLQESKSFESYGILQSKLLNGITLFHRKTPRESCKTKCLKSLQIYEELVKLCPYGRRTLVLIAARGVGRRTIKSHLLRHDPENFATVIPYTSRKQKATEREGREYHFVSYHYMKEEMENEKFLECGELNGKLYGTKLDSIKEVIKKGQVCVLDCGPQAINVIRNREFMPYIVFIDTPPYEEFKHIYNIHRDSLRPRTDEELKQICLESQAIKNIYGHLFDLTLVNRNTEITFRRYLEEWRRRRYEAVLLTECLSGYPWFLIQEFWARGTLKGRSSVAV
ncbi:MAGUK p55 subfamily member 2 [Trichinella britovi]|uniref:MAGUK p55 subfamily member 2 n=1 Tax=Trichinella britovi TaxID=45882 RepID=A0A0V1D7N9_TRIBR|nr:MAGUK p55 subfamily member 2 [Trichinella britovi]